MPQSPAHSDDDKSMDDAAPARMADPATFELSIGDTIIIGLGCVAAGIALGFFLPFIGGFAARFPLPFGDLLEKLSAFDQPWVVVLRPIIGAALGVIAAIIIWLSCPRITIDENTIRIDRHDDHPLLITRASFATAYFDSGKLTILTTGGHKAFTGSVEGKKDRVAAAFTERGYRWGVI